MRKIFFDDLPRIGKKINWEKSVGYMVNFIYDDIEGTVEIIDYFKSESGKSQYLTIKYKGIEHNIQTQRFKSCDLHSLLSYKTYEIIEEVLNGLMEKDIISMCNILNLVHLLRSLLCGTNQFISQ